jgi:hypothetical protein
MRRGLLIAGVALGVLLFAIPAFARETTLGDLPDPPKPSCPDTPCLAVSRTTAIQVKVGDKRDVYTATRDGKLVAWSITLSKPGASQIDFFNKNLGGEPTARITVMRPGKKLRYRVTGQGDVQKLTPWLGKTVEFPLDRPLTVKKGYVVALTVPTWAPGLAANLDKANAWRASRGKDTCDDTQAQTAQQTLGGLSQYRCLYRGVRVLYTALVISTP